jgi:hypothetical protein
MPTQVKFYNREEFRVLDDARLALAKKRGEDPAWLSANKAEYGWARIDEVAEPGTCVMWEAYWFHDPQDPGDAAARENALANPNINHFLSRFYWKDWSHIRAPLCVLCPNGQEWCIDAKSSNGDGWTVTGEAPLVSASPSIVVPGYHGFLGSNGQPPGWFSDPI